MFTIYFVDNKLHSVPSSIAPYIAACRTKIIMGNGKSRDTGLDGSTMTWAYGTKKPKPNDDQGKGKTKTGEKDDTSKIIHVRPILVDLIHEQKPANWMTSRDEGSFI
ncbi:hypothetical protein MAR_006229 [Mya arenaria]|uniref:Uncharacterized protein n=1 Tax=Mya arenaria TaxID=6604 RepID=A0ABY7D9Y9_MYAAR|nr:hypothetical protein MAR_006229 [Mya arenaria]